MIDLHEQVVVFHLPECDGQPESSLSKQRVAAAELQQAAERWRQVHPGQLHGNHQNGKGATKLSFLVSQCAMLTTHRCMCFWMGYNWMTTSRHCFTFAAKLDNVNKSYLYCFIVFSTVLCIFWDCFFFCRLRRRRRFPGRLKQSRTIMKCTSEQPTL